MKLQSAARDFLYICSRKFAENPPETSQPQIRHKIFGRPNIRRKIVFAGLMAVKKFCLGSSSQPYRLRVEVQERVSELWYSAQHWLFKIGDELNDNLRLEESGYGYGVGTVDSLQYEGGWNSDGYFGC